MTKQYAQYSKIPFQQAKLNQQKEVVGVFFTNKTHAPLNHLVSYRTITPAVLPSSLICNCHSQPNTPKFFLHLDEVDWSFNRVKILVQRCKTSSMSSKYQKHTTKKVQLMPKQNLLNCWPQSKYE